MQMHYDLCEYETEFFQDLADGFGALNLFRTRDNQLRVGGEKRVLVGRITYWDAMGSFWIETFSTDIPLVVFENLVTEAKEVIKTR
jgi:hypothetical protein